MDSLDECLLRVDTLATLLIDEFKKYPVDRLSLRIACRTAEWPVTLEKGLQDLWGDTNFDAYELAPLRRLDVIEAAKENGIDPELFVEEVAEKGVVSFAIKPVTLQFLINTYKKGGGLPSTQADLYLSGCLRLCEEQSQQRIDGKLSGNLSSRQLLAVAARIAAITQYGNRYAIWKGIDIGDVPDEDITVSELAGGKEIVDGVAFEVTERALRETLDTGLFSSRGPNRLGWAHQTYAEFLAARFVIQNNMVLPQIKSLITHPADPENKLVPQLHETAAWLSSMIPGVFAEIMQSDPEVLLRSDVSKAGDTEREALVCALLTQIEEGKFFPRNLGKDQFKKLLHPNLTTQLQIAIRDCQNIYTRRAAIDIAEACELQELQHDILEIALNVEESLTMRTEAAHAISVIADDEVKAKMLPLAIGQGGNDPDDELKGCALSALWPNMLTVKELFEILTPPKNESLFGAYNGFVVYDLAKNLKLSTEELIPALNWVNNQGIRNEIPYHFKDLVESVMSNAWDEIDNKDVLDKFAAAILSRIIKYDYLHANDKSDVFERVQKNPDKRKAVLVSMLSLLSSDESFILCHSPFVISDDLCWLIERLAITEDITIKTRLIKLIHYLFSFHDESHVDAVLKACKSEPVLAEQFSWLINPVILGSPEAKKMKHDYLESLKWQEGRPKKTLVNPTPQERISDCLDKFEKGDPAGWWLMNLEMTLEPDSTHYGTELEADLRELPGWKVADDLTKARVIDAAIKYLTVQDPKPFEWIESNKLHRPDFSGYRAFVLLLNAGSNYLSALTDLIWKKWSSVILAYPTDGDGKDIQKALVNIAYSKAPDEVIAALRCLIDKENKENNYIYVLQLIEQCWDENIANVLLQKAMESETKPENMGCHLGILLDHDFTPARRFAESILSLGIWLEGEERQKAIIAGKILLQHSSSQQWPYLWKVLLQEQKFGKEILLVAANGQRFGTLGIQSALSELQLAEFYMYITRLFPHNDDPKRQGANFVSSEDNVRYYRDNILNQLQHRGTTEACDAIGQIVMEFPDLDWIKIILLDAKIQARRKSWQPLSPSEILKLASNSHVRLVQNGIELLDVLVESLQGLEKTFQGETPAAIDLWNEKRETKNIVSYTPKDENRFSDYVKRFLDSQLKERGIILNREVEIRRGEGDSKGERTDIHVDAIAFGPKKEESDRISVIIEAKGCWNTGVMTAMETQLVKRYLKDNPSSNGLYLVG